MLARKSEAVLGINVRAVNMEEVIMRINQAIKLNQRVYIACVNSHAIVMSLKDPECANALNSADILLPDGVGIILASKLLGGAIKKRISGPDVFLEFTRRINTAGGCRYFFYGSTDDVLEKIREKLAREFPNIEVAGTCSPPFREITVAENNKVIEIINKAHSDILWVGMTAPKQEKWIARNLEDLNVSVAVAVGAGFDFYAGRINRAPLWMQRVGLEWFWRLVKEPKRLWRRYLVGNTIFIWLVLKEFLKVRILRKNSPHSIINPLFENYSQKSGSKKG